LLRTSNRRYISISFNYLVTNTPAHTILVLGSGAREHALVTALAADPGVSRVLCAPGNAGTASSAVNLPADLSHPAALADLARANLVSLTVVGPELPLSAGVVDVFEAEGLPIVGPTAAAARLETSKVWAKQFMARHHVPTARFVAVEDERSALDVVAAGTLGWPLVVKADGLAAGKGVVVAETADAAGAAVRDMMSGARFGPAGARLVLEQCLQGPELSFFVLTDGRAAMPLGTAQDHKRAADGDLGPNTGGMGAFSPSPLVDTALEARILAEIVEPVLLGMREEGHPYRGFLYCGLMLTATGPAVIEFNARLGDPEAQVLLPLGEPLLPLLQAVTTRTLPSRAAETTAACRVGVVVASGGYPDAFVTGKPIDGLAEAAALEAVRVFHAGTRTADGRIVTSGGRVLTIVGEGSSFRAAMDRAYAGVDRIRFEGAFSRRDIGLKALPAQTHPS
jgi:phosphoribosylamine---glycine ligase